MAGSNTNNVVQTSTGEFKRGNLPNENRQDILKRMEASGRLFVTDDGRQLHAMEFYQQYVVPQNLANKKVTVQGNFGDKGGSFTFTPGGLTQGERQAAAQPEQKAEEAKTKQEEEQKKGGWFSRNWKWLLGAIAVIGVGIGAYFLFRNKKSKSSGEQSNKENVAENTGKSAEPVVQTPTNSNDNSIQTLPNVSNTLVTVGGATSALPSANTATPNQQAQYLNDIYTNRQKGMG